MDSAYTKHILVTGGAGFIGGTFLNRMVPRYPNYRFINVDALTPISDLASVTVQHEPNYIFIQGDIRDHRFLEHLFETEPITDIIHFAAETHVDVSIEKPQLFIETNVLGTGNLLTLALRHAIHRFVHISTDEVYGALGPTDPSFTEETLLAPNSPYSASKAGSDMLVRSFHKTYGLNVVITRCSNNYGPRQDITKFIPRAITTLLQGDPIPVYGEGLQVRDWLFVDDHVEAIMLAFQNGQAGEVYNVGGGVEKQNIEVARLLAELAGKPDHITFVADRKGHDFRYSIDDTKIRSLGYTAKTPFESGLQATFEWYKNRKK